MQEDISSFEDVVIKGTQYPTSLDVTVTPESTNDSVGSAEPSESEGE